jgi:hypothetical protein
MDRLTSMTPATNSMHPGSGELRAAETRSSEVVKHGSEPKRAAQPVDVVYVGGHGRSGSTVLALLLGRLPGVVPVGGLINLWERGLQKNYQCGCGSDFRDCAFWDSVGNEAFGGWENVDAGEILHLKHAVTRYRHIPWLLAPRSPSGFSEKLREYSGYVASVYRAVTRVSGCNVVVDNSHEPTHALLLHRSPGVQPQVIHLVRDSRGVAFSASKQMLRPEATTGTTYMARHSAAGASREWVVANLPFHLMPTSSIPQIRIYYESFVASPTTEIARIIEFLGTRVSDSELSSFGSEAIDITENHMMSGNPHRLGRTQIQLRLDEEWRTKMRPKDRWLVTLLTSPLALAYGYLGGRRSRQTRSAAQVQNG